MKEYILNGAKPPIKLHDLAKRTLTRSKHCYHAFDYVDRIERDEDSGITFVRKKRLFVERPEPPKTPEQLERIIKGLSRKSWLRMSEHVIRHPAKFTRFITLTYHHVWPDQKGVKKQFRAILKLIDRAGAKNYFWVLEFQSRGAPHFHLWHDGAPVPEDQLLSFWRRVTNDETITRVSDEVCRKTPAHYVMKEACKRYQKLPPANWPSGRMWGHNRITLKQLTQIPDCLLDTVNVHSIVFPDSTGNPPLSLQSTNGTI